MQDAPELKISAGQHSDKGRKETNQDFHGLCVPKAPQLGAKFTIMDYLIWNEIPTVLGNLVGGLAFTGLTLYATHIKTGATRSFK